jgi:hypothetical protein
MTTHTLIADDYGRNSIKKLIAHDTEIPDNKARLALDLIVRWGMITGTISGEDSAGRAKVVDLAPGEVVDRACDIADLAIEKIRALGWFVEAPGPEALLRNTDD